jgi:hypothetical protein
MKNVHLIPTNKPSRLWTNNLRRRLELDEFPEQHPNNIAKHIYITSDEEPKHLDYYITKITDSNGERYSVGQRLDTNDSDYSNCKKIILTTDQDLIKDGVQAISDKFLEWFIKNLTCEKVEVEKLDTFKKTNEVYVDEIAGGNYYEIIKNYKITIPQEEPKALTKLEIAKNIAAIGIGKEEPKQETLELKRNYQKHSLTKTKGYKLWCNIIQRCYNPKNHSYKYYGEKGVVMEDYFKNSYENFIDWIKGIANYDNWLNSSELSLDRIDNTLGYIRGNIKFSTKTEQVENQNLRIDNKSGYKGVCYHKLNKKYGATITINKSKVFLGYYDTALEAALVYDNYVLKNNLNRKTNL